MHNKPKTFEGNCYDTRLLYTYTYTYNRLTYACTFLGRARNNIMADQRGKEIRNHLI